MIDNKQEIIIMVHPTGREVKRMPADGRTLVAALREFAATIDGADLESVQHTGFGTRFKAPDGTNYRATFRRRGA